ncbi:probable RNA-binding protein 1 at C-terminar half [Coccomyxa sp. Obi]|nr:probable RNA-binding protein 1 at C-terminar half [Coccomyxa sp. Obi]
MSVTAVQVTNFPSQISQDEFGKLFSRLDGFLGCRIIRTGNAEPVGYIDFRDVSAANNATSIYDGWRGWSSAGLIMKTMQPLPSGGLPMKRSREGPDMYGDPRLKQSRPSNLGFAPSNGGFGSPAQQQPAMGFNRAPNLDQAPTIPGIGTVGTPQAVQQQPVAQPRPQQVLQGNSSSLAYGMDTVQQPATAPRASRPADLPTAQPYTIGSNVGQQPQQQQPQQQQQLDAVRAAIIQQQGVNMGVSQGYSSPVYQGQVQNSQRPASQGPGPNTFANLLPVGGGGSSGPQYGTLGNQFPMGQQTNGPQFGGMQAAPLAASGMREGPAPHLMQQTQLQQQQYPQSAQPLGQPGNQMYQPSGQPMRQPQPVQEQQFFQDSFGGVPPAQPEAAFQPAPETQTHRVVEVVQPAAQEEPLPPEANPTLFLSGLPLDITKREVAHIFRPFDGFKELRLVQKVDRNNKNVMWCFAEFSTTELAARTMKVLQGYAIDMDDPDSPTLRVSYARALNNPKVKDGRASAAEEPSARAAEQRRGPQSDAYSAHRPHTDPRSGSRDIRGPPEQAPFRGEPNGIPHDPRHDMRGRAPPRDAGPGRRAVPHQRGDMATPSGAPEYERGPPGGFGYSPKADGFSPNERRMDGPPGSRGPPHTGQDRSRGPPGFSGGPPRDRGGRHGPNSGGTGQAKRRPRGPHPNRRT